MKRVRKLMPIYFGILIFVSTYANAEPDAPGKVDARRAEIVAWAPWNGAWEGEIKQIMAPKGLVGNFDKPFKIRVEKSVAGYSLFTQGEKGLWEKYSGAVTGFSPSNVAATVLVHSGRGEYVETIAITLTRTSEDQAEATWLRTVSNWALPESDRLHRFFTVAGGTFSRVKPVPLSGAGNL